MFHLEIMRRTLTIGMDQSCPKSVEFRVSLTASAEDPQRELVENSPDSGRCLPPLLASYNRDARLETEGSLRTFEIQPREKGTGVGALPDKSRSQSKFLCFEGHLRRWLQSSSFLEFGEMGAES
jgi:hypothetical protein